MHTYQSLAKAMSLFLWGGLLVALDLWIQAEIRVDLLPDEIGIVLCWMAYARCAGAVDGDLASRLRLVAAGHGLLVLLALADHFPRASGESEHLLLTVLGWLGTGIRVLGPWLLVATCERTGIQSGMSRWRTFALLNTLLSVPAALFSMFSTVTGSPSRSLELFAGSGDSIAIGLFALALALVLGLLWILACRTTEATARRLADRARRESDEDDARPAT